MTSAAYAILIKELSAVCEKHRVSLIGISLSESIYSEIEICPWPLTEKDALRVQTRATVDSRGGGEFSYVTGFGGDKT